MIKRDLLDSIISSCFKGKIILLLGARHVGKTTLLKEVEKQINQPSVWLDASEPNTYKALIKAKTSDLLLQLIGPNNKLVIIDEAHEIPEIGKQLKLIHKSNPQIQVIATGSSSFELHSHTAKELKGHKIEYHLFPISYNEIIKSNPLQEAKKILNARLIYGLYPDVISNPGKEKEILAEIVHSYIHKEILHIGGIRKPGNIENLLRTLAYQVGNEIGYNDLARSIGHINIITIEKYLELFEKTYIIYKLPTLHRNHKNEIKEGKKFYFYDNGIRNILINNFNLFHVRKDREELWENFLIGERLKNNHYSNKVVTNYFWRTYDRAEVNYIEEQGRVLNAFEIKWASENVKFPNSFLEAYPNHSTTIISQSNFELFIQDRPLY